MNTDQKAILRYLARQPSPALATDILAGIGPESGHHALAVLEYRGFVQQRGQRWELTAAGQNDPVVEIERALLEKD